LDQNHSSTDIVNEDMTESEVIQYIVNAFEGVDTVSSSGDAFFFYDPPSELPVDHRFPFATLVTGDHYDTASNLDRLSVFRLNIGVSAETYRSLFGGEEIHRGSTAPPEKSFDFADLDRIMPHPVYAAQHWVCALNPSADTFEAIKALLAEAYERAATRYARQGHLPAADGA
jgi:hypothetical protein